MLCVADWILEEINNLNGRKDKGNIIYWLLGQKQGIDIYEVIFIKYLDHAI